MTVEVRPDDQYATESETSDVSDKAKDGEATTTSSDGADRTSQIGPEADNTPIEGFEEEEKDTSKAPASKARTRRTSSES